MQSKNYWFYCIYFYIVVGISLIKIYKIIVVIDKLVSKTAIKSIKYLI